MKKVTTFKVNKLDNDLCKWHSVPVGSYSIELINLEAPGINPGWFPLGLVSTVSSGRYTGIIPGQENKEIYNSGTMGSFGIATINPKEVVRILTENGYKQVN